MKVVFGDLNEMLSELKEREISDVRVEALYDERYSKEGVPFLRMYVAVQALLAQQLYGPREKITAYLYAHYEKVTYKGIKPFSQDELRSRFDDNLKAKEKVRNHLAESGFTARAGYFKEE